MDMTTFQTEVEKHKRLLWRVSWSILSQPDDCADAVQEALTRAWEGRNGLRNTRSFRPWLVRILVNTCNDMLRRQIRQPVQPLADDTAAAELIDDPPPLREAIKRLSPEHRAVIVLHYLEGYSVKEIAVMTDVPSGTVKSRMSYARRYLRGFLGDSPAPDERSGKK